VLADWSGHPSHGVRHLPHYVERLGSPGLRVDGDASETSSTAGVIGLDAHGLIGYPVLETALSLGAERAGDLGVSCVGIRNCGHAGRAGSWAELGATLGFVTLVFLGGSEPPFPVVAAPGARPSMHTNPIAVGVPGVHTDLILDMATSAIAFGKATIALERGEPLPEQSAVDAAGRPTTDPRGLLGGGFLLPAAGHKGFGLAAAVEALGVAITGASLPGTELAEGVLVVMIRHDALVESTLARQGVESIEHRIRASSDDGSILAPGDLERMARAGRTLGVTDEVVAELRALAGG
jgi:uncharacterized oxidoreductase